MSESRPPGIAVYICHRCIPDGARFPRQWTQEGVHVQVHELPCSGKTEAQYLFHAMEAGARGCVVITCPKGECHLAQGNYRAEVRVGTVQRLLSEIGMEPERALLERCGPGDDLDGLARDAVSRICALGESPIRVARSIV